MHVERSKSDGTAQVYERLDTLLQELSEVHSTAEGLFVHLKDLHGGAVFGLESNVDHYQHRVFINENDWARYGRRWGLPGLGEIR